jgi:starvation-inducible outer membrane lipoprotein
MMRNYILTLILSLAFLLTGCEVIGDIFSAGVYTGVFIVVFVIVVIVVVVARMGRKG